MTRRRVPLVVFLALADAALALSFHSAIAWATIAFPIAAMFVSAPRIATRIATSLTWLSWILVAAIAARGTVVGFPVGVVLAALAGLFLVDERAFPAGRAFLPAALGVFLAAASNASAPYFTPIAWAATVAMLFWLAATLPSKTALRRGVTIAAMAVPAAVIGQSVIMFLPWAQPRVEEATASFMDPTTAATGLSIGGRLGDVQRLALSRRIVLRLWSAQPISLRSGVYTQFDGRAWRASLTPAGAQLLTPSSAVTAPRSMDLVSGPWRAGATAPTSSQAFARVVVEEQTAGFLPAPAGVDAVRSVDGPIALDRFGLVHAPSQPPEMYAIRYTAGPEPTHQGDDALAAECLRLPPTVDPRVSELAGGLGPETASAAQKIDRTVAHLQARCRYSLDVGAFKTADPLAEFLFDKKKGYCEYFATATVMLLRLQGVPSRYVNGLSVRDADRRGDHFLVRASDAHAWAEAYVPGKGWVEVDATPPGDYAAVHDAGFSWFEETIETIKSWTIGVSRTALFATIAALATLMLAAGAASVALRRLRRRKPPLARVAAMPALGVSSELAECLRSVEAVWTRAGCPRPSHRALLEHVASLPPDRVNADVRALSRDVALCVYQSAYGAQNVAPEELSRLQRALTAVTVSRESGVGSP